MHRAEKMSSPESEPGEPIAGSACVESVVYRMLLYLVMVSP